MAWNSARIRPLSAECMPRTNSPSMLMSMLPSAVQSRLPKLSPLRGHSNSNSIDEEDYGSRRSSVSAPGSGSRTPIAGIANAIVLSSDRVDESLYDTECMSDEGTSTPPIGYSRRNVVADDRNGIGWKFANQGLNLLSLAIDESSTTSTDSRYGNGGFARHLYIHSLTYLLRALPTNLTPDEKSSIQSALPVEIAKPAYLQSASDKPELSTGLEPSFLHRTLASFIVQLFLMFQFLLPYIKSLLNAAYQYERNHKLSEKVLSQGIDTMDTIGKRGISLAGVVFGMADGKVGQLVTGMASWIVEGVTGGIHEGVGEGLAIMGARKPILPVDSQ